MSLVKGNPQLVAAVSQLLHGPEMGDLYKDISRALYVLSSNLKSVFSTPCSEGKEVSLYMFRWAWTCVLTATFSCHEDLKL